MNIAQRIISRDSSRDRAEMGRQITLTLKSAMGGAGLAIAALGLINMFAVLLVPRIIQHWNALPAPQENLFQWLALGGGIVGGVFGWWLSSHRH